MWWRDICWKSSEAAADNWLEGRNVVGRRGQVVHRCRSSDGKMLWLIGWWRRWCSSSSCSQVGRQAYDAADGVPLALLSGLDTSVDVNAIDTSVDAVINTDESTLGSAAENLNSSNSWLSSSAVTEGVERWKVCRMRRRLICPSTKSWLSLTRYRR